MSFCREKLKEQCQNTQYTQKQAYDIFQKTATNLHRFLLYRRIKVYSLGTVVAQFL
jgi:hypothetical protein